MKIVSIVGARPQFIKAAVVSRVLRSKHTEVLVHTGQHFDYNMSQTFFDELGIPMADYNLGISGGTHAQMTGKMMIAIEEVLIKEKPDWLLLYGDTNSTVAAALAAAKLYIPVCHVEAGNRAHSRKDPEEINRICTDHFSSLLLACTQSCYDEMKNEGLYERGALVGDPMYDAFIQYSKKKTIKDITLKTLDGNDIVVPDDYYYMTCHREENTRDDATLMEIFKAMSLLECITIYPVHPRNKQRAMRLKEQYNFSNIFLVEPVGYIESICLVNNCKKVVTDSGGLMREAFFAKKQCVCILDHCSWKELFVDNRNQLAKPLAEDIIAKLSKDQVIDDSYNPFGDGHAAERIVAEIEKFGG